jgi:hypothetical protein
MNRLRCFLFAAVVMICSATFALGGDIQGPGKSDPPPPPPASMLITEPTTPMSSNDTEIVWQDLTTKMLLEILLTIY